MAKHYLIISQLLLESTDLQLFHTTAFNLANGMI